MYFEVSTFGYGFWPTENFVNLCQRLSTHHILFICLYHNSLVSVNNVNSKMCTSYFSTIVAPKKKTIRLGQSCILPVELEFTPVEY